MYTLYRLNADELSVEFLESLKTLFRHKIIEIAVCEAESVEQVDILPAPRLRGGRL